jgi:hypothetical protein
MQCKERCICKSTCRKQTHSRNDYHVCSACGTFWYGRTHRHFPFPGWWMDRLWMLEGHVGNFFGYEYYLATKKGEVTGWRKKMKTYTIVRRGSQVVFKCTKCPFEIDTELFGGSVGQARTKTAKAMNEHFNADHRFAQPSTSTSNKPT